MKRRLTVIGVVLLSCAGLVGTSPAASAAPARPARISGHVTGPTPQVYPAFDDPAGDPCPFPVHGEFPVNHVVGYTYANAAGHVVAAYYTGALIMRVFRTDTGRSVTANIGGDGLQTFAADGSSVLYGVGPFSSTQHPGDHPGPELAVLHGVSALAIAADGTKTILYSSRVVDLCSKLG